METKTITKEWNQYFDFNVGDVVKLKSGGPNMTVDGAGGSRLTCVWFNQHERCTASFDQGALEKVASET
jgi:uncharacterized protein YodC (DUF2158 family)